MFKRILLTVLIIGFLSPLAFAGDVSDQLTQMKEQQEQIERARQAWTQLEYAYRVLQEVNTKVQEIKDSSNFDLLPTELKVTFNAAWTHYKTCLAAIQANADIVEAFTWRP